MRLICPNCDAQYEVADDAIPDEGRDVQCSACGHAWYQLSPEALARQAAEAALFDPPEPVAPPPPEVSLPEEEPAWAEPAAEAPPPVPAPAMPQRNLDESVMAVLREEAEREEQARAREGAALEMQGDLGLEMAAPSAAARRIAQMKSDEAEEHAEPLARASKGRDLLPDIEEINSTLSPAAIEEDPEGDGPVLQGRRRSGFRLGFGLMLILALLLVGLYVAAPKLAQSVPALAGPMESYVVLIDGLRLKLDAMIQSAVSAVQG